MADLPVEMDSRIRALESRIYSLSRLSSNLADGDTNGCTNCNTNGCTNCIANELMNVLLPGEDRPLSGREIVKMLGAARRSK